MNPYSIIAAPAKTHDGILAMKAWIGARNPRSIRITGTTILPETTKDRRQLKAKKTDLSSKGNAYGFDRI